MVIIFWALFSLLFKANYWQSHDGDFHLQRGFAAIEALKLGQFPLRWSSLLNYGCGLPVFNFFYPLMYYLFWFFSLFNLNLILSFKLIYSIFYLLGTISLYFLLYSLLKSRLSSLAGATLFALNPYYLSLIYVRGNPEILTYSLLPLILLSIHKSKYLLLYISLILYFLSHNTTVLVTLPLIIIFTGYQFIKSKKIDYFLVLTLCLAFLSSGFFLGPAIIEKNLVKLGSNVAADYQQHFPTLSQLFFSPWGFGYSQTGPADGMSFKFGYVQWFILFLSLTLSIFYRRLLFLVIPLIFCLFLILPSSQYFWEKIPLLQQLQYPWRLLGLCVFITAILASIILKSLSSQYRLLLLLFLIFGSIITNRHHIQVVSNPNLPDFTRIGSTTIADELLPINALKSCYLNSHQLTYYPHAYAITVNNLPVNYYDCSGYVCLSSGNTSTSNFNWHYISTPTQRFFNLLSLFSTILWFILAFIKRR